MAEVEINPRALPAKAHVKTDDKILKIIPQPPSCVKNGFAKVHLSQ
jgi:hypothetical protein